MVDLNRSALDRLRTGFAGRVLLPGDPPYPLAAALYGSRIQARPALIAQCAGVEDVIRAVTFGHDLGLETAVRGGGHATAGFATVDGGLVIDLRPMNAVSIDPAQRTATVTGAATVADLDRAAQTHGLATTGARGSSVGMIGFALGGGNGWLDRTFGLACDNVLSAELVTADGAVLRASEDEDPELFWGLHGGGGNFGVVTSLTLRLHPLPVTTAMLLLWPPEQGPAVLRAYRDMMESAPDEVGGGALYLMAPEADFVPQHLVGKLALAVLVVYAGAETEARTVAADLLQLRHEGELIAEMPYADIQSMLDDPPGYRTYWSAASLRAMPDEAVDVVHAGGLGIELPSASSQLIFPQGGAVGRGRTDYPVPWRRAPWVVHPLAQWPDAADDQRAQQWVLDCVAQLRPWSIDSVALNYLTGEDAEGVRASFGPDNHERLTRLKSQIDPDNLFHRNANIAPR